MGIQKLSSDEGVTFDVMGEKRTFHGIHLFSSGDNPASANLAGFKESHFAELLCRQCMGEKPAVYQSFMESDFLLRSKESHEQHVRELEEFEKLPSSQKKVLKNPSVAYGVNKKSIFMKVEHIDVTKTFPQDLMHDIILGSLKHEIICLLVDTVIERKAIGIHTVNDRIEKYSKFFGENTPSSIDIKTLEEGKLRTTASETLALAYMLPFVLLEHDDLSKGVKSVCQEKNLKCFILRLNLLDLQMSKEFTLKDIENLRKMTWKHHKLFLECYPGKAIPKMHFEIHMATQVLLFGPLRQHWCLR